jgi:tetratricopeptide (TPR) repeat protein
MNPGSGDNPIRFYVSVPVWGANHVDLFINIGLPSLLSPGNLPGLRHLRESRFIVHTLPEDETRLTGAPAFRRLAELIPTELRLIREQVVSPYRTMSECHLEIMRLAAADDAFALFPSPDHVWSDGAMTRIEQLAASGKTAVHILGIRLDRITFVPEITKWKSADGALAIPPRSLATLALRHLHPIAHCHFWKRSDAGGGNQFNPANMLWRAGDEGLLAHCFHLHPLMVRSEDRRADFGGTIDDDLVMRVCPDFEKHHVVRDSDELLCCEISPPMHQIDLPCTRYSIEDVAFWAEKLANPLHRRLVREPLRLHSGTATEALWRDVETEAKQAIEGIERVQKLGPIMLYARCPSVFLARADRYREQLGKMRYRIALRAIDLLRALKLLPFPSRMRLVQADALMAAGNFEDAYRVLRQVLVYLPDDPSVLSRCTMAAMTVRDVEAAIGYADQAVVLAPDNIPLKIQRAGVMQALYRWDDALADYDRALSVMPQRDDLKANRARVLEMRQAVREGRASAQPPTHRDERARRLIAEGDAALATGDAAGAVHAFEALLADHPNDVDTLSRAVVAATAAGQTAQAAAYSDRAVALDPANLALVVQHGNMMQALGFWGRALADYNRAIAAFPERADLYTARAQVLDALGRTEEAASDRAQAAALTPPAS